MMTNQDFANGDSGFTGDGSMAPSGTIDPSKLAPLPGGIPGIFYDPATGNIYDQNGTPAPGHYDASTGIYNNGSQNLTLNPGFNANAPGTAPGGSNAAFTPSAGPATSTGATNTNGAPVVGMTTIGSSSPVPTGTNYAPPQGYYTGANPAPTFSAPTYTKPPAFSYGDFVAPDPNDLNKDPSFQYALKTEQDAIQKSAAARGVLNTGGTIYDLLSNANDLAQTGYANLYNRGLSTYQTNRQNALDQYNTNYGTQYTDPYKYSYMGAQDTYNANANNYQQGANYASHNYDLGQQYSWMKNLFDYQQGQDAFLNKYRLLQLQ